MAFGNSDDDNDEDEDDDDEDDDDDEKDDDDEEKDDDDEEKDDDDDDDEDDDGGDDESRGSSELLSAARWKMTPERTHSESHGIKIFFFFSICVFVMLLYHVCLMSRPSTFFGLSSLPTSFLFFFC